MRMRERRFHGISGRRAGESGSVLRGFSRFLACRASHLNVQTTVNRFPENPILLLSLFFFYFLVTRHNMHIAYI